ncbi:MAG TPA: FAD-dependent monooxygenase [Candidatus Sumerlaeota bacterium]|nr:FAD-dependent monooxygenase [Candidatus Sumerlaeota bacterium]
MLRLQNITLDFRHSDEALWRAILLQLGIEPHDLLSFRICKKSIDARKRSHIQFIYQVDAEVLGEVSILARLGGASPVKPVPDESYRMPERVPERAVGDRPGKARPIVVGAGPCGLFTALLLAQVGLRPLLLDRGKSALERVRDVAHFWETGQLDPESNVQFGEGGAGTFSDGKLTTQIKERGNRIRKVLDELIRAGAPPEIAYEAKPHLGTDLLVGVVTRLRQAIEAYGGEVRFGAHVTGLLIREGQVRGVRLAGGEELEAGAVALAIGHSARDTFRMLHEAGVPLEAKAFSIGVRIEHPQSVIDRAQYGPFGGDPRLGPAEYKLVHHCANGRSVYTFCMCPGGQVIAAASETGGVVTNGMSVHARDAVNANAALLVGVNPDDFSIPGSQAAERSPLAGVEFQRHWEARAFRMAGGDYRAPAQTVGDFLAGRGSASWSGVEPSYRPGVCPSDLVGCLPPFAVEALRQSLPAFERKLNGFSMPEAVLTGVETRSSSPVRIVRGEDFQSVGVAGLFPAGEGAGYAGGIVSAAVDGLRVAEAVAANRGRFF